MSTHAQMRLIDVDEYYRLAQIGVLSEDDRVELIEGEIIPMTPIGNRHASCVMRLIELIMTKLERKVIINPQNPLRLNRYNEPQPDITILKRDPNFYENKTPDAGDTHIVIEIADSSIQHDRKTKRALYAKRGIPEYWLVNLTNNTIEVYTQPEQNTYKTQITYHRGDNIQSTIWPDLILDVDEII